MAVDLVREKALRVVVDVVGKKAYSNLALDDVLKDPRLRDVDRAFISELVYGTLRFLNSLDRMISCFSKIKLKKISPWILNILRMGVYQIIYMRVPASAACDESVNLAKRFGHQASAGFVNGILRNVAKKHETISLDTLEDKYSFPQWLIEKWVKDLGENFTVDLMMALNQRPEIIIRGNLLKIDFESLKGELTKEGVIFEPGKYIKEALILKGASIEKLKSFGKGYFYVQDESSMIGVKVLDPRPGESILDVCAAPGGKASYAASLMNNQGTLIACDIHPHRELLLEENFKRLGVHIAKTQVLDATFCMDDYKDKFDRVLADVPCSGFGVIRRKPEIKWEKTEVDVSSITGLQKKILQNVSSYVRPGGVLVYSTCTLNKEENEDIVEAFLKENRNFIAQPLNPHLPKGLETKNQDQHHITLYPNIHGVDGFFISKIKRVK
jgi:16S rRNA (cytosine967-C5)-methyltransferase